MKLFTMVLLLFVFAGCTSPNRFSADDFIGGVKLFCQKVDYQGSPMRANSYLFHYNGATKLGNLGQYVYSTYSENKVGIGYVYESNTGVELEKRILFSLKSLDGDKSIQVEINREDLVLTMDQKRLSCQEVTVESQKVEESKLLEAHEHYLQEVEKNRKI